jgi:hypothetical protein
VGPLLFLYNRTHIKVIHNANIKLSSGFLCAGECKNEKEKEI